MLLLKIRVDCNPELLVVIGPNGPSKNNIWTLVFGSTQTELMLWTSYIMDVIYSLRVLSLSMIMIFWYGVRTERQHNNIRSRNITMNAIVRNNISNLFFVFCFTLWSQGKSKEKKLLSLSLRLNFWGLYISILAQARSFVLISLWEVNCVEGIYHSW